MSFNISGNVSLPSSVTDQTPRSATSGVFAFPTSAPGPIGDTTPDTGDFTAITCTTVTVSGNASIGGNATITGTLALGSDLAINTNKFNVTASSGNTAIAGTLAVTGAVTLSSTLGLTGNLAINTNKFNVTASSGNTTIAGTLGVTGAVTLSSTLGVTGDVAINTNKFNVTASSGNTTIAGTLGVTGLSTLGSWKGTADLGGAVVVLTPGSTVALDSTLGNIFTLTPGEDETINVATVPATGQRIIIRILTSGATSRTLTFGTNFKSTGTLATGVTTAKTFIIEFVSDGTNFNEISRTVAM